MRSRRRLAFIALFTTLIIVGVPLSVTMGELLSRAYLPLARRNWPLPSPTPGPGRLWVSEVVYDPLGTETEGEWIEVYNPGGYALALAGYKLGDEESREGNEAMLQFPGEAVIEAGGVLVIAYRASAFQQLYGRLPDYEIVESEQGVPNLVKYTAWAGGPLKLENDGDELLVLDGADQPVDKLSWGDSTWAFDPPAVDVAEGHSLERSPGCQDSDSAVDWIDQPAPGPGSAAACIPTPTPTPPSTPTFSATPTQTQTNTLTPGIDDTLTPTPSATPTPTPAGPVILLASEALYDPAGVEPDGEWIELYNPGENTLALDGVKVGDEETRGEGEGMLGFPPGAQVSAGRAIVIANRATTFYAAYGFNPDYEMEDSDPAVPDMLPYREWAGGSVNLRNDGDEVLLLGADDLPLDALSWGDSSWAFDPPAPDVAEGHSLERVPADQDRDDAEDWVDQPFPQPGQVDLSPPATPTPTETQTATHTPTASITPTPSLTATPSPTPTGTLTPSVTASQTATPTQTNTAIAFPTSTPTQTNTQTPTQTNTPTPQPTSTEGRLLISEALYDPSVGEPDGEWIELYNGGGSAIDLSAYKVGDEETYGGGEGMYRFPDGAWLVSGQVIVVANQATVFWTVNGFLPDYELVDSDPLVPNLARYSAWAGGNIYLNNAGDELLVLDGADQLVDTLSWGDSAWAFDPPVPGVPQNHSLERRPAYQDTDTAADWVDQPAPQPGIVAPPSATPTPAPGDTPTATQTATITPTPSQTPTSTITTPTPTITPTSGGRRLLISELAYDPVGEEPSGEWLELYNAGEYALDMSDYKVGDEETSGGGEGMYRFPAGVSIAAGQVIVIANQAATFQGAYGFPPDYELVESDPAVPNLAKYSAWSSGNLALNNAGDEALVLDGSDALVDALSWGASAWAFDPPAPDVAEGHTLERFPADVDTDTAADWIDCASPNPGEVNLSPLGSGRKPSRR